MKQLSNYIIEKFKINSKTVQSQNLEEIIELLEDNFESKTNLKLEYIMINVVNDKYRNPEKGEWIQISTGVYKDEKRMNIIIDYVKDQLNKNGFKDYKIEEHYGKIGSYIDIYMKK